MTTSPGKWRFSVDRGGTFTDVVALSPDKKYHTLKLLSRSADYGDASIAGITRVLGLGSGALLPGDLIESIRLGTTVATNALLERSGGPVALLTTAGFEDLLYIGNQSRPDIFSLNIEKPLPLYSCAKSVAGRIGPGGSEEEPLDEVRLGAAAREILDLGIDTVAVVFMHSWGNPTHELRAAEILRRLGIRRVITSHESVNLIKVVSRGQSAVVDAYLSPVLVSYIESIKAFTGDIDIEFIESAGTLSTPAGFSGKNAIFSGPAGGVVGVASVAEELGLPGVVGFDMGGTSTDVSRFEGTSARVHEETVAGIELQSESLDIKAVASGGGSILWFDGERMRVGPKSAGAMPGPASYGLGGPLTITDANLITGRLDPASLPETFGLASDAPLSTRAAIDALNEVAREIATASGEDRPPRDPKDIALGFTQIANERMALAIREISVSRGVDIRDYGLVSFGGAGGQHACAIASLLGIKKIVHHPLGGVLSAYGIGLSKKATRAMKTVLAGFDEEGFPGLAEVGHELCAELARGEGDDLILKTSVDLRPVGADTYITVELTDYDGTLGAFRAEYRRLFGFDLDQSVLEAVNVRVEAASSGEFFIPYAEDASSAQCGSERSGEAEVHYSTGPLKAGVYDRSSLSSEPIAGPALIVDEFSTFVVDPGFIASGAGGGSIIIERTREGAGAVLAGDLAASERPDPVLLEVFSSAFISVAREMGEVLRNTAFSVNIKERLDFSCAIFDSSGNLVANAPHIPVHLGSMPDTVRAIIEDHGADTCEGDVYLSNNPYRGGSHLPDMTVVAPVFSSEGKILFFCASRGHYADVGGRTPGSMPPLSTSIEEEGILIDGMRIVRGGHFFEDKLREVFASGPYPARNIEECLKDTMAQIAACHKGAVGLFELTERYGAPLVSRYMGFVQENAAFAVRKALSEFLGNKDRFEASFKDSLDDGTPLAVKVVITAGASPPETLRLVVDFTGTGPAHKEDNLNAPLSVTRSAVLYVLRSLTSEDISLNSGCLDCVEIRVPEGCLLNPAYPLAVSSGNVETSQRVVDVLLGALGLAAASQGTMNNLLFEVEGESPYYETIAGGSGATQSAGGACGVQVHMTNTRITDPEILETRHPGVRLSNFTIRKGSGGSGGEGGSSGGDGVIREIRFLKPASVSIISERRRTRPYGLCGGEAGRAGRNLLRKDDGEIRELSHRDFVKLSPGESIVIETPGGGGYGRGRAGGK